MAVPKKKTSPARRRSRSASKHVTVHNVVPCESCGDWRRPHHVCAHCGTYDGRVVMIPKAVRRQRKAQEEARDES